MPALDDILHERLEALKSSHLLRSLRPLERGNFPMVERGGKSLISFSCNDYLGLSHHPAVIEAAIRATEQYGAGAGASRLVTGEHPLYAELETRLARWHGTEAACVFGSGYLANLGTISALMGEGDLILADKFSHACMLDGARLSGAALKRFAHNDLTHLETLLAKYRSVHKHCLILTEAVFSMDGDRAPLEALAVLAARHDAWLLIDGAHDLSRHCERSEAIHANLTASGGKWIAAVASLPRNDGTLWVGTLSKTLGSYGGYVCGSRVLIDYLKTSARSLIYTTALPPGVIAAAAAAIDFINDNPDILQQPIQKARLFTRMMELPEAQSAIVPLIIGEAEEALRQSALLEEAGFLVTAIRPPTVPPGTARLRFAFCAQHEQVDIERLINQLKSAPLTQPSPQGEGFTSFAAAKPTLPSPWGEG
jgi:8-amino-7-oxononanoate synthase